MKQEPFLTTENLRTTPERAMALAIGGATSARVLEDTGNEANQLSVASGNASIIGNGLTSKAPIKSAPAAASNSNSSSISQPRAKASKRRFSASGRRF